MQSSHPEGDRHAALIRIAMPLAGNGFTSDAIFAQLRASFDSEKTDREIRDVIDWCKTKNPSPSGYGQQSNGTRPVARLNGKNGYSPQPTPPTPVKTHDELADAILAGELVDEADWRERSPTSLPETFSGDAAALFRALYLPTDHVNIVTRYMVNEKGKANPQGGGKTLLRDEWLEWFGTKGVPVADAGAWVRPNPCNPQGSGKDGAICDADIACHRFLMIESDSLSLEKQLALYAKLPLAIAAIMLSGGDSAHAWLRLDCDDAETYRATVEQIYIILAPLGFDRANKNPSRLSRLPGAKRIIGATGDGEQRLIYLNATPKPLNLEALRAESTHIEGLIRGDALKVRFREYMRPKPIPFTLKYLKGQTLHDGFYFRESEVTLWSGMSGHGKSTMLSTIILKLISAGTPIFICSLEYKPEKLCEMLAHIMSSRMPTADEGAEFLDAFGPMFMFADVVGDIAPEKLIALMRAAHRRHGAKHFFIDSLMRVSGLEEDYPKQGQFVNDLQAIAKETGGHIHLVAHPRKIDESVRARKMDIKGSSMLANNADNIVTMRRNTAKRDLIESGMMTPEKDAAMHDAEFTVEKQRETGWEGSFKLKFNRITKLFEIFVPPERQEKEHPNARRR